MKKSSRSFIKVGKRVIRTLTTEEIKKVITIAENRSRRNALIIKLGISTGMRVGEVAHARLENLHIIDNVWHIAIETVLDEDEKGDSWSPKYEGNRDVPIPNNLYAEIWALADGREKGYIFTSERKIKSASGTYPMSTRRFQQIYHNIAKGVGFEPLKRKFHTLRHTYATSLKRNKQPIEQIQRLLGHKHADTTWRYIESLPMSAAETKKITQIVSDELLVK